MSNREWLAKEAMESSEQEIEQVVNFFLFIKKRHNPDYYDALMLSYPTMANGWFSKAEDEAWKDYQ